MTHDSSTIFITLCYYFLMELQPPRSRSTDTIVPDTTLFRSPADLGELSRAIQAVLQRPRSAQPMTAPHAADAVGEAADGPGRPVIFVVDDRSEEHTSELQSLMRITYAVFCLNNKNNRPQINRN